MNTQTFIFWNNFSRFLLIGLSSLILLAGAQQMVLGDVYQRGPNSVLAIGEDCLNPDEPSCNEPGPGGGSEPIEEPAPAPEQPAPAPEQPAPAPQCVDEFKYNQCVACNQSEPVYQNTCSGAYTTGSRQHDAACASWCAAPAPQPTPQPAPSCPANQVVDTTQRCVGNQWCTFNIHVREDCSRYEGGAYGCVNDVRCGFVQPTPPPTPTPIQPTPSPVQPTPSPVQPTPTPRPECPRSGQPGTRQICGGQWAYNICNPIEFDSSGRATKYECVWSGNDLCRGVIGCAAPAVTPTPTPRPPAPTPTPAPTAPPARGGDVNVTNTNTNTNTNTVTVNREVVRETFGNVGVATTTTDGQVLGVKELPKTGLPVLAWAALAFIPAGFGMRRFSKVSKDAENNPNYLWEDRQFKQDIDN